MSAILPNHMTRRRLKNIGDGESVYVVPWAMYAKMDGSLYLNGNFTFEHSAGGTVCLMVTKRAGQWIVDPTGCYDYKWDREEASYTGVYEELPVAKLCEITGQGRSYYE